MIRDYKSSWIANRLVEFLLLRYNHLVNLLFEYVWLTIPDGPRLGSYSVRHLSLWHGYAHIYGNLKVRLAASTVCAVSVWLRQSPPIITGRDPGVDYSNPSAVKVFTTSSLRGISVLMFSSRISSLIFCFCFLRFLISSRICLS